MENTLTRNETLDELNLLTTELSQKYNIPCKLKPNMSINCAESVYNRNGFVTTIDIGVSEIYNAPKSLRHPINPPVSEFNFARVVLNTFHETTHYKQKNQLFRQNVLSQNGQRQLIQDIACAASEDYYWMNGNYKINLNEIQAEYCGIQSAYDYLCEEFDNIPAAHHEQILLQVVNYKMKNFTYFVNQEKPFDSLDEVYNAFDKAYENAMNTKHLYFVNRDIHKDPVKQFMNQHPDIKDNFLKAQTPHEQDNCVAAIHLHLYPNIVTTYPAIRTINLSSGTVILKETPVAKIKHSNSRNIDLNLWLDNIVQNSCNADNNIPDY